MLAAVGIAVLVAAGVGMYWYTRLDDEVRTRVETLLAGQYPQLQVSVASARIVPDQGIEIRGVTLLEPNLSGPRAVLVEVDEIMLTCSTDLTELAQGRLHLKEIRVKRPTLSATLRPDGTWSLARLFPLPNLGGEPVPAVVEGGRLRVFDPLANPSRTYVVRDIQMRVEPNALATSTIGAALPSRKLQVSGTAQADYLRRIDFDGTLDPANASAWNLRGQIAGIDFSPELCRALPTVLSDRLSAWQSLRARIDATFELASTSAVAPLGYQVDAKFTQGAWHDAASPLPLSDLSGQLHVDPTGWQVTKVSATSGAATVLLAASSQGASPRSPHSVSLEIRRWQLDSKILAALPPAARDAWAMFQPAGVIDVRGQMHFDGVRWRPDLSIDCREASFAFRDFPYRLVGGTGTMRLRDEVIGVSIRAFAGTQAVKCAGNITNPGPRWQGWATVETEGPVPVDPRLIGALNRPLQEVARSFHPRGAVTLTGHFAKKTGEGPLESKISIGLIDGEISYAQFPYPLRDLSGRIELNAGRWYFRDLAARNDSGRVTGVGDWIDTPAGGELRLDFAATDVPLEDELRDALPAAAQRAWNDLQPRGTLDHLDIALRYRGGDASPSVHVRAQKWPTQQNLPGRSLTLQPQSVPYRLDEVTGEIVVHNGTIEMRNLKAQHGRTQFSASGLADTTPQGRGRLRITQWTADRLALDNDLLKALPAALRGGLERLALTGHLNIRGGIEFLFDATPTAGVSTQARTRPEPTQSNWDLQFDLDEGSLNVGLPLEHVHGSVRLIGGSQGEQFSTRGELAVDSLMCRGLQVTQLVGPIWLDNRLAALGAWAHRGEPGRLPRQMSGKLFGGALAGDAQVSLLGEGQFQLQTTLADANLATAAAELAPAQRDLRGRLFAGLQLTGAGANPESWRGRGNIRLRDADVYELPVMLSMLKLLRVKSPDRTAFTHADSEFELIGRRIGFQRIDFEGDAITLRGKGEVTLDRQIDLTFHSIVGRTNEQIPYLFPVLGEASRQILEIRVTGTLDNPQLDSKAFPALNDTLEKIFPDLNPNGRNPWLPVRSARSP